MSTETCPFRTGKKYKTLTIEEKLLAIKDLEDGQSIKSVAQKFNILETTLVGIYRRKEKLKREVSENPHYLSKKRLRVDPYLELQNEVAKFLDNCSSAGVKVSLAQIQTYAIQCAKKIGLEDFKASKSWLTQLKSNIRQNKLCRPILSNEIREILTIRNSPTMEENSMETIDSNEQEAEQPEKESEPQQESEQPEPALNDLEQQEKESEQQQESPPQRELEQQEQQLEDLEQETELEDLGQETELEDLQQEKALEDLQQEKESEQQQESQQKEPELVNSEQDLENESESQHVQESESEELEQEENSTVENCSSQIGSIATSSSFDNVVAVPPIRYQVVTPFYHYDPQITYVQCLEALSTLKKGLLNYEMIPSAFSKYLEEFEFFFLYQRYHRQP